VKTFINFFIKLSLYTTPLKIPCQSGSKYVKFTFNALALFSVAVVLNILTLS